MFYDSVLTEDSFACTLCAICALCTCVWDNPVKLQEWFHCVIYCTPFLLKWEFCP